MAGFSKPEVKKIKDFLETGGKKILLYHQDCDGVCSAALFLKFFKGFEAISRKGPKTDDTFIKELSKKSPNLIVSLDLPLDQDHKNVDKLRAKIPGCRWILIDHHVITKDINGEGFIHINPRFRKKDAYVPVSCIVYDMLNSLGKDAMPYVWIACIGMLGDHAEIRSVVKDCAVAYPEMASPSVDSRLKPAIGMVNAAISAMEERGAKLALDELVRSEVLDDFEKNRKLGKLKEKMDEEISRLMAKFEAKKDEHPEIKFVSYELDTKFGLIATVSGMLCEMFLDYVVLVYRKAGDAWKVSLRCQTGRVNLDKLIRKCLMEKDSGGGHERAAGGVVHDIEAFKKRLMAEMGK